MTDWIEEVTSLLSSWTEEELIQECQKFERCEKNVQEIVREIEGNVEPRFSADAPVFLLNEARPSKKLGQHGRKKYLYYFAMSLKIYLAKNHEERFSDEYKALEEVLPDSIEKLIRFIDKNKLVPSDARAYQNPDENFINLQRIPADTLPRHEIFRPLAETLADPRPKIKAVLAHELTHAFIKEETGVSTQPINTNTALGETMVLIEEDLGLKDKDKSRDAELLAINEAAGHVSGRIFSDDSFNVRAYETKSGIERSEAHQAVYLLEKLSQEYDSDSEKLSRIREVSARAIKKKHSKQEANPFFRDIQKKLSEKISRIPDPDSALGYLELLVVEKTEKVEMENYHAIGIAAEKMMESEMKILNFFNMTGDSKFKEDTYDLNRSWKEFVPVEDDVPSNYEKHLHEDEELRFITPQEFEDALGKLEQLPEAGQLKDTLKNLEKIQKGEKNFRENLETEFKEEEDALAEETKIVVTQIFDAEVTDNRKIRQTEGELREHILNHISTRREMISEAQKLCRELIETEKQLEKIEEKSFQEKESEEMKQLIELSNRNVKIAKKSLSKLEEADSLLEDAVTQLKSQG